MKAFESNAVFTKSLLPKSYYVGPVRSANQLASSTVGIGFAPDVDSSSANIKAYKSDTNILESSRIMMSKQHGTPASLYITDGLTMFAKEYPVGLPAAQGAHAKANSKVKNK